MLVAQKLEIIDGTFGVWNDFSRQLVAWVFDIFRLSADSAFTKKLNSFVLFKNSMIDIKKRGDYFIIVSGIWFRLKNLVYEELPKFRIKRAEVDPEANQNDINNPIDFMIEFETVKGTRTIVPNTIEDWVMRTLTETIKKHKASKRSDDDYLLFLFRLLAIRYRIEYPLTGEKGYVLSDDLNLILHSKICSAAFKVLGENRKKTAPKKGSSLSRKRKANN